MVFLIIIFTRKTYGISKVMVSVEQKNEKSYAYTVQGVQMFGRHLLCKLGQHQAQIHCFSTQASVFRAVSSVCTFSYYTNTPADSSVLKALVASSSKMASLVTFTMMQMAVIDPLPKSRPYKYECSHRYPCLSQERWTR